MIKNKYSMQNQKFKIKWFPNNELFDKYFEY